MGKRGYLTPRERASILAAQGGTCVVPGCVETDRLIGEHTIPNAIKSGKPDALMCKAHHAIKTPSDRKVIAHISHLRLETGQQARRAKRKAEGKRPLLKGRTEMQGRGFEKGLRKKMNGEVVKRV